MGVEIKRNIKDLWWKSFVSEREDILGFDASILMHPNVWQASGHLDSFSDPLVECSETGKRYREDNIFIIETEGKDKKQLLSIEANDIEDAKNQIKDKSAQITNLKDHEENNLPSPEGGILSEPRMFNLMFKTGVGPVDDGKSFAYLRPETAQQIFINFKNVLDSTSKSIPFGIAQIGKAFRNEVSPRNFLFRLREFEQMELEFFVEKGADEDWHQYWVDKRLGWWVEPVSYTHLTLPTNREV